MKTWRITLGHSVHSVTLKQESERNSEHICFAFVIEDVWVKYNKLCCVSLHIVGPRYVTMHNAQPRETQGEPCLKNPHGINEHSAFRIARDDIRRHTEIKLQYKCSSNS